MYLVQQTSSDAASSPTPSVRLFTNAILPKCSMCLLPPLPSPSLSAPRLSHSVAASLCLSALSFSLSLSLSAALSLGLSVCPFSSLLFSSLLLSCPLRPLLSSSFPSALSSLARSLARLLRYHVMCYTPSCRSNSCGCCCCCCRSFISGAVLCVVFHAMLLPLFAMRVTSRRDRSLIIGGCVRALQRYDQGGIPDIAQFVRME